MVTTIEDVSLSHIHPDREINARRTETSEGISELTASIAAHGLAQSLLVRPAEKAGHYLIVAGHRRHKALLAIADAGGTIVGETVDPETYRVPVIVIYSDDQHARELSQAENLVRLPQHPADTYQTFHALAETGMSEKDIAERFGIDKQQVKQSLKLGQVAPQILDAWRNGELENDNYGESSLDIIKALTLAPSIKEQTQLFDELRQRDRLEVSYIRRALGADNLELQKFIKFVSTGAYVEAGGVITVDLFGDNHVVEDSALVMQLAEAKLRTMADEVLADGWQWSAMDYELPQGWSWNWEKLPTNKKKTTKADKARSGVVFKVGWNGELNVTYGVIKPAETKAKAKAEAIAAGEPEPSAISNALLERLSDQATVAMGQALQADNRIALCAILAGFLTMPDHYADNRAVPVRVRLDAPKWATSRKPEPFAEALTRMRKLSMAELLDAVAGIAQEAVNLTMGYNKTAPFTDGAAALADAVDPKTLQDELHKAFDLTDYFESVPLAMIVAAVSEAISEEEGRKVAKQKKAGAVAYAVANIGATGWLPVELRTSGYAGPGSK